MKQYRVSVKKELVDDGLGTEDLAAGKVAGVISNRLHERYQVGDVVQLSPPRGEFFFDVASAAPGTPVILLSAGVGATPMVSILDSILKSSTPDRSVTWAHTARHAHSVCFGKHIRSIASSAGSQVRSALFVKNVEDGDEQGIDYDYAGSLSLDRLGDEGALWLQDKSAEYFICGPEDWMVKMRGGLTAMGVSAERVHLELFRTGDV
jgi:nitric oxide dioxygenase